jgi:predicted peptidase
MEAQAPLKVLFLFMLLVVLLPIASVDARQDNPVTLFKIAELKSGLNLRYTLSLPPSFNSGRAYPLVIALHYGGKITPFYGKDFLISFVEPALRDLDAIIVGPDCPSEGWTNTVSEEAVLELILLLMGEYKIDPDRLVILGYSMGGSGACYMAARHPDIFSAAIPISAPADPYNTPFVEETPLFIIHGELDKIYPVQEVKNLYKKQIKYVKESKMIVVERAAHHELLRFIPSLKASILWIIKIWEER